MIIGLFWPNKKIIFFCKLLVSAYTSQNQHVFFFNFCLNGISNEINNQVSVPNLLTHTELKHGMVKPKTHIPSQHLHWSTWGPCWSSQSPWCDYPSGFSPRWCYTGPPFWGPLAQNWLEQDRCIAEVSEIRRVKQTRPKEKCQNGPTVPSPF